MVKYYSDSLDATFAALSDPTRRAILERLARGAASVTELAEPFAVSLPAISKHLKVLRQAGLLAREKDGRVHRCCMVVGPMKDAALWIDRYRRFWERQFDALGNYLNQLEKEDRTWPPRALSQKPRSASKGRSRRLARKSSGHGRTQKN